jgi:hypothetical protein
MGMLLELNDTFEFFEYRGVIIFLSETLIENCFTFVNRRYFICLGRELLNISTLLRPTTQYFYEKEFSPKFL